MNRTAVEKHIRPRGEARILIIGAGGLGSAAVACLAQSGISVLGVADGDTVEITNLHRQIIHVSMDQGHMKVDSAEKYLLDHGFEGAIQKYPFRLEPDNIIGIIKKYHVVIDASDTFRSKFLINDACVLAGIPLVHAGIVRFEGQMMNVIPRRTSCLRCLFESPPPPETAVTCREAGVLGPAVGMLGAMQVVEALKILDETGTPLLNKTITMDIRNFRFCEIPVFRDTSCPVCGDEPRIKSLVEENYPSLKIPRENGCR